MTTPSSDLSGHLIGGEKEPEAPVKSGEIVSKSPTRLAFARFRKDKLSMISLTVVALYFLAAIAAPILVKTGVLDPYTFNQDLLDADTLPASGWGGISADHLLGIEPRSGRDLMARVWYGISFSLGISIAATMIAVTIGVVLGIVSGASGGWVDAIIGRVIDLTLAFPQTLMLLAFSAVGITLLVDAGVPSGDAADSLYVILVLGLFGWTSIARLVRGQVLTIRENEFVHAATLIGASRLRIYFREILPNLWAPILVSFTLILPAFVSAEAALSFLGVSIKPPTPTLGNILTNSISYAQNAPVYFFVPAILIAVIVVSFNLLGDGLRDALDPKANR